jgi:hypothetical protein
VGVSFDIKKACRRPYTVFVKMSLSFFLMKKKYYF